jgi:hypothetical protein
MKKIYFDESCIADGVYAGMPMSIYHADPAISKSGLSDFAQSPAHYIGRREEPEKKSKSMDLGSLVHSMILEPDKKDAYVVAPKINKNTKEYKAWAAAHSGNLIVDQETYQDAQRMAANVAAHPAASILTTGGQSEVGVFWTDPERNIRIKVRPDHLPGGTVVTDLKTTRDASEAMFGTQSFNLKYHWSAALTLRVLSRVTGQAFTDYYLVAVENSAPFAVAVYLFDAIQVRLAAEQIDKQLDLYAKCYHAKNWPGYPEIVQPVKWPRWAWNVMSPRSDEELFE